MEITVNIKCDALVNAINRICDVIGGSDVAKFEPKEKPKLPKIENKVARKEIKESKEEATVETEVKDVAEIKPETARKALAELSKLKGKEVAKGVIEGFGCAKFTDIPEEKYPELMKAIKEA